MSDLHSRARAAGLIWHYTDGAGQPRTAPDDSIDAVLSALDRDRPPPATSRAVPVGQPIPVPPGPWRLTLETGAVSSGTGPLPPLPMGYHLLDQGGTLTHLIAAPDRLPEPARGWGVTLPLFALWQDAPTGMGSYPLLGRLAAGLAPLGCGFLGINPVHAGFPLDPGNFSPYTPSHRRRLNILHVAAGPDPGPPGDLIDHATTIPARLTALRAAYARFPGDPAFDAWRADQGPALERFALHQALSDIHGPYWNHWPASLQTPESSQVQEFARKSSDAIRFHAWAQWQAEGQLAAARSQAAGMAQGLYLDLAVGTHPHGAETWAEPAAFAQGVSLGAPPDLLGPSGQRWNLAPLRPDTLLATGMAALRDTLRAQFRHAGMLRIDHILGFDRAFWLPDGLPGLYVTMPRAEMLATVRIEATRARALVIGEDLGTIPEGLRAALAASGILGCRLAMFERDWQGDRAFLPPERYDRLALASWGSHDTPTWSGWRAGRDLDWRAELDELPDPAAAQATRRAEVADFDRLAGTDPEALHRHLARSASLLVAIQAEDALGCPEQCNLPGTVHQHPNWRRRLPLAVDKLPRSGPFRAAAALMATAGRNPKDPP